MIRRFLLGAGIVCLLQMSSLASDQPDDLPKPDSQLVFTGKINVPSADEVKAQIQAWTKTQPVGSAEKLIAEWQKGTQRPILDRTVETIASSDAEVASLLKNLDGQAKTEIIEHSFFKSAKQSLFVKNNVSLYVARSLANKKMFEESLAILRTITVERVVDPAAFYFYKSACENKLRMKEEGLSSVHRLLTSIPNAPERYTAIASIMQDEMQKWEEADLGDIARRMEEIEGRLGNAKAGPATRGRQKEVIGLLDKMIEDLEKQC